RKMLKFWRSSDKGLPDIAGLCNHLWLIARGRTKLALPPQLVETTWISAGDVWKSWLIF
ncbi:hypothetical protein PanWU01x14_086370, partial [Parasponia andersonii]